MDMQWKGITSGVPPSGVGGLGCSPVLIVRVGLGLDRPPSHAPASPTSQIGCEAHKHQKHWENTQKLQQKTPVTKPIPYATWQYGSRSRSLIGLHLGEELADVIDRHPLSPYMLPFVLEACRRFGRNVNELRIRPDGSL